jgi:mannose-6-phosphate isomerase-like protein (cupin superfamily)
MSYAKDVGEVSAVRRLIDDVPQLAMRTGTHVRFVAPGSVTDKRYGLFEWNMGPQSGGPDPHFHKTFSESFYVTRGTVALFDGRTWLSAKPGEFVFVPEGGIHAFHNTSGEAASMLILFAPGPPRETYFEELAEIGNSGRQLSDAEWVELWARHDQYPAA